MRDEEETLAPRLKDHDPAVDEALGAMQAEHSAHEAVLHEFLMLIAALVAENAFAALKGPVLRLGGPDAPAAASYPLEQAYAPSIADIAAAAKSLCS